MADLEIGARIGRWRRRRGLSQVALAGLVGRSESWLSQVERGVRGVDSLAVVRELARVLRVDVDDLAPSAATGSHRAGRSGAVDIERALFAPRAGESASAVGVTAAHAAYQDCRYAEVLAGLPELMTRLAAVADPQLSAAGWTVVSKMLTKVGADDLALVAAERARDAARHSGDRADLGMAVYQVVCALLPTGRAEVAELLALQTVDELGDADDAIRSVVGCVVADRGRRGGSAERRGRGGGPARPCAAACGCAGTRRQPPVVGIRADERHAAPGIGCRGAGRRACRAGSRGGSRPDAFRSCVAQPTGTGRARSRVGPQLSQARRGGGPDPAGRRARGSGDPAAQRVCPRDRQHSAGPQPGAGREPCPRSR